MGVSFWWETKHCPMTAMKIYHRFFKDTYELSWVFLISEEVHRNVTTKRYGTRGSSPNYQPRLLKYDSPRSTYIDLDAPAPSTSRYRDFISRLVGGSQSWTVFLVKPWCQKCSYQKSMFCHWNPILRGSIRISMHPKNTLFFVSKLFVTFHKMKGKSIKFLTQDPTKVVSSNLSALER